MMLPFPESLPAELQHEVAGYMRRKEYAAAFTALYEYCKTAYFTRHDHFLQVTELLEEIAGKEQSPELMTKARLRKATALVRLGRFAEAGAANGAVNPDALNATLRVQWLLTNGLICIGMGDGGGAIAWYEQALARATEAGDADLLFMAHNSIATYYAGIGQYSRTVEYLRLAEQYIGANRIHAGIVWGNLALNLAFIDEHEQGRKYLDNMRGVATLDEAPELYVNYLGICAEYALKTDVGAAVEFLERQRNVSRAHGLPEKELIATINLAKRYNNVGKTKESLEECSRAEALLEYAADNSCKFQISMTFADNYALAGEWEKAFRSLADGYNTYTDIVAARTQTSAANMEVRLKTAEERRTRELAVAEAEHRRQELGTTARHLRELQELLQTTKQEAAGIASASDPAVLRSGVARLVANLARQIEFSDSRLTFDMQFRALYPKFVDSLLLHNSALTQAELRLCCTIKMHYSAKETAAVLCVSEKSVEEYRRRLRKKLGLPPRGNIAAALAALENAGDGAKNTS